MNPLPDHLKRRIPAAGVVLSVAMVPLAIWAIVLLCTDTRDDSFAWLSGASRGVTVTEPCRGDFCRGVWEDPTGRSVQGPVHLSSPLKYARPRPFFETAEVNDGTAYLYGLRSLLGLLAPVLLVIAALELLRQVVLHRRRERRRHEAIRVWRARYEPSS
ncbi:hypothetical protein HH310_23150 [Actinoplanes sp. TBRC 11911]|uniref:hypothetical protein n=1 Tax=Actinoplanes sp. TBRC 11911 TaxID=2729386 RepID=UPI00145D25B6|nr:hypothetical protein [Actinoplanes sp. TBRC 11911]NMO54068.1 hypothetical protein [Actinoplanes sp. TBRC 11911]